MIASKLLKEEIEADTKVFREKSRIIEDIINRNLALRKVKISGVKKMTITLTLEKDRDFIMAPIKGFSPVINITKTFDFNLFNSSTSEKQNEIILSVIDASVNEAARKFGWHKKPLEEIINTVRELDFKHSYLEWKLKLSKDRKYKAGIQVDMLPEGATISIVFYSYDDLLIRTVSLIDLRPDRYFVTALMGECKWISNTEFELVDKKKEIHFKASLLKGAAEVYFTPINRDANKVIDDLLILAASTSNEQALSLLQTRINDQT